MSSNALDPPSLSDVLVARRTIAKHLDPTPLYNYPALDGTLGTQTWVKHENHQPTGAFKVRGGVNLVSHLDDDERKRGLITASTGNHGQSIAYAAKLYDVASIICVPEQANPVKVEAIKSWGAEIEVFGKDYDEAREHCEELASQHGYRYVHSGNEPLLIAGVATETLEILEKQPDVDVIIVPIGGGSGAAGACIVAKGLNPNIKVIGVQSESAPSAFHSWKSRELKEGPNQTLAEGLATRTSFELPQRVLWDLLDDFLLVPDEELQKATAMLIELTRNLVEPAGAAALAGALRIKDELEGRNVALILSGGNISPSQLKEIVRLM
jgi:threonine dehydratase